ncbi:MAG: hypothetical protein ABI461_20580, partial [Polyangiaceae bacterium]
KKSHIVLFAAFAGTIAMAACSLNPQPIPPGDQDTDAGKFSGGSTSDAAATPVVTDSGAGAIADADGAADASDAGTEEDAGDADTDAGDI